MGERFVDNGHSGLTWPDLDRIEKVARELCKDVGVNPDQIGGTWDCGSLPSNKAAWLSWAEEAKIEIAYADMLEALERILAHTETVYEGEMFVKEIARSAIAAAKNAKPGAK